MPSHAEPITLEKYLLLTTMASSGGSIWLALEAVASTALDKGWDLSEVRTWDEWETWDGTP